MSKYIKLEDAIHNINLEVAGRKEYTGDMKANLFFALDELPTIEVSEDAISRADAIKAIEAEHISGSMAEIQRIYDADPYSSNTDLEETLLGIFYAIQDAPSVVSKELQSYKDWVDLKDSEIIAECVHRFGGEYVVKACEKMLGGDKK